MTHEAFMKKLEVMVQGWRWREDKKGKKGMKFTFLCTFFLFFLLRKCWGTIGWLAQSEKNPVRDCGAAHRCLFVLPHFINQQPEAPLKSARQIGSSLVCSHVAISVEQKSVRNLYAVTWHHKPSLSFFCYFPLPSFLCNKYSLRMPNVTSINPSFVSAELTKASIKFFLNSKLFLFLIITTIIVRCLSSVWNFTLLDSSATWV